MEALVQPMVSFPKTVTPPATLHSTRTNPSSVTDSHTEEDTAVQFVVCWAFATWASKNKRKAPKIFLKRFAKRDCILCGLYKIIVDKDLQRCNVNLSRDTDVSNYMLYSTKNQMYRPYKL